MTYSPIDILGGWVKQKTQTPLDILGGWIKQDAQNPLNTLGGWFKKETQTHSINSGLGTNQKTQIWLTSSVKTTFEWWVRDYNRSKDSTSKRYSHGSISKICCD